MITPEIIEKLKARFLDGSAVGIFGTLVTLVYQHPEMSKQLLMFILAWILLKRGVDQSFGKLISALNNLQSAFTLKKDEDERRFTFLETEMKSLKQQKGELK